MSKNVIHNFDIVIKNSASRKSSEDLKEIFLKELAKVSKEISQGKDILQLWQEYQNKSVFTSSNISIEGIENNTLRRIQSPIISTKQDFNISQGALEFVFFKTLDNSNKVIGSLPAINIYSRTLKEENGLENLNNSVTSQIYTTSVSTEQSLLIPSKILMTDNEPYSGIIKMELKKKLNAELIEKETDLTNYETTIPKDIDNKRDKEYFAKQGNIDKEDKIENLYKVSESSINNMSWKQVSDLMIFKLLELSKEEKNIYLKEKYDILIKKIARPNINIQQLFSEHEELFLLLKTLFPGLPEKITFQTQNTVYPNLGSQKMYPEIGGDNIYFKASGVIIDNIKYQLKLKEDSSVLRSIDSIIKDPVDPLHHQFLITTALQIYNAAKSKGATGKGALLIMAQASIESGYGKDAMRRGDYNLFGTMTCKTCSDFKVENSHGRIKDFSEVGKYEASIKDYFDKKLKKWTGVADLIKNKDFTADDINKAFYTGKYIEDKKIRNKTGHGSYNFDGVSKDETVNNNKYGEELVKQMGDFKKRLINSIDFQILKNQKEMIEVNNKADFKNNTNVSTSILIGNDKNFIELIIENLENENKKLVEIKKDITN